MRNWLLITTCVIFFVGGSSEPSRSAQAPKSTAKKAAAAPQFIQDKLRPFLTQHCTACHGGTKPKAELTLTTITDQATFVSRRKSLEKVLDQLRARAMPPEDKPQPTQAEVEEITKGIEEELFKLDCVGKKDPGRVTIRRLNRAEYNNTIRDLIGVSFQPASDFPLDDVGYGFDNIGDVLSLPPVLMERYLAAAEKITEEAIVTNPAAKLASKRFAGDKLKNDGGGNVGGNGVGLFSSGEAYIEFPSPADGQYMIRAKAYGQQAGADPARMALRLDGKELKEFDVTAVEGAGKVYEFQTKITGGKHRVAAAFTNDFYNPKDPNPNNRG